jgi:hypothetical protein
MPIDIERELQQIRSVSGWNWLYLALDKIREQVNNFAQNVGADTKPLPSPPQIAAIQVKSSGTGLVHVVLSDPSPIQKGIRYFVEFHTNPSFQGAHSVHLGASREAVLRLPGLDDSSSPQSFYFRGYSQYPGSPPSQPVQYGSAVSPGGSDTLTLLPSTGSGSASNLGNEAGSGFGKNLKRAL